MFDAHYFLIDIAAATPAAANTGADVSDVPPPKPGAPPGWMYESHVAEQVLEEMLAEANVTVVRELIGLASAVKAGRNPLPPPSPLSNR